MSFLRRLTMTVTVQTPGSTIDRYGNVTDDWNAPTTRTASAWVTQTGSTEELLGRDVTTTVATIFLASDDPLTFKDRVVFDGTTWMVDGIPDVMSGRLGPHHVQARLKVVDG